MNDRQHVIERNSEAITSDNHVGSALRTSAIHLGVDSKLLDTSLGVPDNAVTVDEDGSGYRCPDPSIRTLCSTTQRRPLRGSMIA